MPAPDALECVTFQVDGEKVWLPFERAVPTSDPRAVRGEMVKAVHGYLFRGLGDAKAQERGLRMLATALDSGDYIVGRVCLVLMDYCAPNCTGRGCAIIRVPGIK